MLYKNKILSLILLLALPVTAQSFTGSEYLQRCQNINIASEKGETPQQAVDRALKAGSCAGYIGGVINGINLIGDMLRQQKAMKKNFICLPKGTQANTLMQMLITYLKTNPPHLDAPVQLHIHNHFMVTYPCQEEANQADRKKP